MNIFDEVIKQIEDRIKCMELNKFRQDDNSILESKIEENKEILKLLKEAQAKEKNKSCKTCRYKYSCERKIWQEDKRIRMARYIYVGDCSEWEQKE